MSFMIQLIGAALAGLLSHWLWFIHGEHDKRAGKYIQGYLILALTSTIIFKLVLGRSLLYSTALVFSIATSYFGALFSSIVIHRLVLAPTRHIPGPYRLKISKLFHFWKNRGLDNYRHLDEWHQQYGDVVRTGPNEVTCFTVEAFEKIYGPASKCTRSVYYEAVDSMISMTHTMDPDVHAIWRRVWDLAFRQQALESYEPAVYFYAQRLVRLLDMTDGRPQEISSCFKRFAFDVIGRVGVGLEFNLLDGRPNRFLDMHDEGGKILGWIVPIPWLPSAILWMPGASRKIQEKETWALSEIEKKRDTLLRRDNVMDYIIEEAQVRGGFDACRRNLLGEWMVLMRAGIDPMVKCLTNMMWYLAQDKTHVDKIRSELASIESIHDHRHLMQLEHLGAVIYETFRLNPGVPSSGGRLTPPEGLEVGGFLIPGNTTVVVPHYTLFRRPDCFVRPNEFLPERWTTNPELVLNKAAFQPWSSGRYQCVGKHLGLMEIRIAAALIIETFDISFAKSYDRTEMFDKMRDHFVALPGPLHVVLNRRNYI